MQTELEECNPAFIVWAKEHGVSLEHYDDWYPWLECWADGYANGVNAVKEIMRGPKESSKEVVVVEEEKINYPCPKCGTQLVDASGGGVECPKEDCDYWFCY